MRFKIIMIKFKKITFCLLMFFALANCAQHSVKFGKRCTQLSANDTYEKSYVWFVDKNLKNEFETKITKENCDKIEGTL